MRKMNREEKMVHEYLLSQGYEEIQHEPNYQGNNFNIPPDFSIKGNVGIEVRRLNQHFFDGTSHKPLEKVEHSLSDGIRNLLKSYNRCEVEKSAFINIRYSRPVRYSKELMKELKNSLDEHLTNIHLPKQFQIRNLTVKLFPSSSKLGDVYQMGVEVDEDSGGPVVSTIYANLRLIIDEKQNKVKPEYEKFDSWWLILVDDISYGISDLDLVQLNNLPPLGHYFDKILLLSPLDISHVKEVKL